MIEVTLIVAGARWASPNISETADPPGSSQTSVGFTESGHAQRKYPVNHSSLAENPLFIPEVK